MILFRQWEIVATTKPNGIYANKYGAWKQSSKNEALKMQL